MSVPHALGTLCAALVIVVSGCAPQTRTVVVPGPYVQWQPAPRSKTSGCIAHDGLPDAACTPGAVDGRVTQDTIGGTICTRGYTSTVRPPSTISEPIKRDQIVAYGLQSATIADYELDHLIPLELGGAPQEVANLWPESRNGQWNAHMKDAVEVFLNHEVCRGAMPLLEAQREIATDWISVYRGHRLSPTSETNG